MRSIAAVGSLQIDNSSEFYWNISYEILNKLKQLEHISIAELITQNL